MTEYLFTVAIPYPPSMNHYWMKTRTGRTYLPKKVVEFRGLVATAVLSARENGDLCRHTLTSKLEVVLGVYPPDRRVRDLDNICKGTLDALTHAGVWEDDAQIDKLTLVRREVLKHGRVCVYIKEKEL